MADVHDRATRSRTMARVKARDTSPELALRRALHRLGLRYRLHGAAAGGALPGRPDLVFAGRRAAVFVHGCFWHRHAGCPRASTPASRRDYWLPKFARNQARDQAAQAALRAAGWRVAVVWECALTRARIDATARALAAWLRADAPPTLELPPPAAATAPDGGPEPGPGSGAGSDVEPGAAPPASRRQS
ncbi:very short patch repair endonuclease [Oceanicella actignis]|uniref:very short patch repair endonuclease n=1 Tax=Oceanicella actignis TaxID=1189325 RepID=UPI0011E72DD6|nr:DNA mismatch endonuclease Vsr [Oceanicella actignis]TYO85174.1 T/G mismatch-specific endonuclease [Oceanicella actignis]